jgi:hypothetical protein
MFKGKFYCEDGGYYSDYSVDKMRLKILEIVEREEKERQSELIQLELTKLDKRLDENMDIDFLDGLSMDEVKMIVSIRNERVKALYNSAKKQYDDWVFKGKSAIEQAANELLKPGEDINNLEKFIGEIPVDFWGKGTFESSSIYKKWSAQIEEAKRKLENANEILRAKARERFGFPDIPEEEDEATFGGRDAIPDDVKTYVWRRDSGKCVKCRSQEKLEFDHIIPVSKGGSNTARNIQLLCEKCNRSKRDSIV